MGMVFTTEIEVKSMNFEVVGDGNPLMGSMSSIFHIEPHLYGVNQVLSQAQICLLDRCILSDES